MSGQDWGGQSRGCGAGCESDQTLQQSWGQPDRRWCQGSLLNRSPALFRGPRAKSPAMASDRGLRTAKAQSPVQCFPASNLCCSSRLPTFLVLGEPF